MAILRDVLREASVALRRCKQNNSTPQFFRSDNGQGRQGWIICVLAYEGCDQRGTRADDYERRWGNSEIFLGVDGVIYRHDFHGVDIGRARSGNGQAKYSETHQVVKANVNTDLRKAVLASGTPQKRDFEAVLRGLRDLPL